MNEFTIIDSYSGHNETPIRTEEELRGHLLSVLKSGINHILLLHSLDSGDLTLGIGRPYGFVEYMNKDGKPPYLITKDQIGESTIEYYEFDSGGTPTPIPSGNCLAIDQVIEIAVFFFNNRKISDDVNWEEE